MTEHSGDPVVGAAVRSARERHGLGLRALAAAIGVSPATLSHLENGKVAVSTVRLRALAAALGVPVGELLVAPVPVYPADNPAEPADWRVFRPLDIREPLASAIAEFVRTGYHAATLRGIAAAAGMSAAAIYDRHPNKQSLLVAALDLTMDEIDGRMAAAAAEAEPGAARMGLLVEALALYHLHRRDLAFLGASEMRSLIPPHRARITARRDAVQHRLDAQIDMGVAAGELRPVWPTRVAGRAISTMCTSLPQWFSHNGPADAGTVARAYAGYAVVMLGGET
ncbi:TetR family transcriptional regulator [Nakamurella sp. YIM 132087]|uniref:TetR family transcriptional regulator n=1 Tax=Nakamurella alba TaxID=2665158 RepID=A0A7K1FQ43_9ACTN|nr:TetR family transcriptional regulator [Nakamurella alba]MTD16268.1 TetR family transcriptional regulator [Nakamurella alba]